MRGYKSGRAAFDLVVDIEYLLLGLGLSLVFVDVSHGLLHGVQGGLDGADVRVVRLFLLGVLFDVLNRADADCDYTTNKSSTTLWITIKSDWMFRPVTEVTCPYFAVETWRV